MARARQTEPGAADEPIGKPNFGPKINLPEKPPADDSPPADEPPADDDEPGFWKKWFTTRNVLVGSGVLLVGLFFWRRRQDQEDEDEMGECPACTLGAFKEVLAKAQQARSVGNCDQALSSLVEAGGIGSEYKELAGQVTQEVAKLKKSCFKP